MPPGVVTVIGTPPGECAGAVAKISLSSSTVKLTAGVEPNETAVAPVKSDPMIATLSPPAVDP